MPRKGLCNVVREKAFRNGQETWRLRTKDGTPIPAFTAFCERNEQYSFRTQKRYAEVASRFIDYLIEAKVFDEPVTAKRLNDVVEAYPTLLRDGSETTAARIRISKETLWLADVAENLDWAPLARKSFDNVFPALNRFLRLSESLGREAYEKAVLQGVRPPAGLNALFNALNGLDKLSGHEVAAMKQNSMFGSVAKYAPKGLTRPRGIQTPSQFAKRPRLILDFPRASLSALIAAASGWRDKALWLLLAGTGIRISEALNVLLDDVDMEAQRVFVFDPNGRRAQLGEGDPNRFRFKGREMAYTYFIPELKRDFFYALHQYLSREFVPCYRPGEPAYLFQYVEPTRRGQPLVDASSAALAQSFRRALHAAHIPPDPKGREWVLHSLRHLYGVYMVNDFPLNPQLGTFGLPLVDVQMMMGHANIRSTAYYARSKRRRLEAKLEASDKAMLGLSAEELKGLPSFNIRLLGDQRD